jgi:hypothetical protein
MTYPANPSSACAHHDAIAYVCEILKKDGLELRHFPDLSNFRDVVLLAVRQNPAAFKFASEDLKNDCEFVLKLFFDPLVSVDFLKFSGDAIFSLPYLKTLMILLAHDPELINIVLEKNEQVFWHCVSFNPNLIGSITSRLSEESYDRADKEIKGNPALAVALLESEKIDKYFMLEFFRHVHDEEILYAFVKRFPKVIGYLYETHCELFLKFLRDDFLLINHLDDSFEFEDCSFEIAHLAIEKGISEFVKISPKIRLHPSFFPTIFPNLSLEDKKAYLATYENKDINPDQFEELLINQIIFENPDFFPFLDEKYRSKAKIVISALNGEAELGLLDDKHPSAFFYASESLRNSHEFCAFVYISLANQQLHKSKLCSFLKDVPDFIKEDSAFWLFVFQFKPEDLSSPCIPLVLRDSLTFYAEIYHSYFNNQFIISQIPSGVFGQDFWLEVLRLDIQHFNQPSFPAKLKNNMKFLKAAYKKFPNFYEVISIELKDKIRLSILEEILSYS